MDCTKQTDTWNGRLRSRHNKSVGQHIRERDALSDTSSSVSVTPWEGRLRSRLGVEAPVETPRVRYNARYNFRNNILPCSF